jgi:hypothetical protein
VLLRLVLLRPFALLLVFFRAAMGCLPSPSVGGDQGQQGVHHGCHQPW